MYGEPVIEVLAEADSQEALHTAEIEAISRFKTMAPFGYNLSIGGDTAPSKNAEVAAKISQKAIGRKVDDDAKIMISQKSKANWGNVEYREKVILAAKASWTPEMRAKRSEQAKAFWAKRKADGWVMPQSHKDNLSKKIVSQETKLKMSAAAKGKPKAPRSDETKAKLSTNAKAAWEDKDAAAIRVASIRAAWTPEKKAAMAAKAAELWKDPAIRAKRLEAMRKEKSVLNSFKEKSCHPQPSIPKVLQKSPFLQPKASLFTPRAPQKFTESLAIPISRKRKLCWALLPLARLSSVPMHPAQPLS
jgi:hypothetical protein